jgi:hypothetical protein
MSNHRPQLLGSDRQLGVGLTGVIKDGNVVTQSPSQKVTKEHWQGSRRNQGSKNQDWKSKHKH